MNTANNEMKRTNFCNRKLHCYAKTSKIRITSKPIARLHEFHHPVITSN